MVSALQNVVATRGVDEVLHFTTNAGLLGVLYSHTLKSRRRLTDDERLEHIFHPNSESRKDSEYLDYVNLSISRINNQFYNVSSGNWHRDKDIWWCILSFDPEILSHEGVLFTTTNNIYTSVMRNVGLDGFQDLFARVVTRWSGNVVYRDSAMLDKYTTCEQAEVLYPKEVSTEFLRKVYVINETDADEIEGQVQAVQHPALDICVDETLFSGRL